MMYDVYQLPITAAKVTSLLNMLHLFLQCVLEDLDLSAPVCISVQTLGSNGLRSDGVHTMYRADKPGVTVS